MVSQAVLTLMRIFTPVNRSPSPQFLREPPAGQKTGAMSVNGFTLVELMVVIGIIGVAAAALILALPGRAQAINQDVEQLATRLSAARDQAVVGGQPIAVWISPSGYGFEQRLAGNWQPMKDRNLERVDWRDDIIANVPADEQLRLAFDNTGLPNQGLQIVLTSGDISVQVKVNDLGEVHIVR